MHISMKNIIFYKLAPLSISINIFFFIALVFFVSGPVVANDNFGNRVCSKTAKIAFKACRYDTKDDYLTAKANCLNVADSEARAECFIDAKLEKSENKTLCFEQRHARRHVCDVIGEAPYDVTDFWIASNFVDPLEIGVSVAANPYFSLVPGTKVFEGGGETVTVTVTTDTKLVNGVTCLVVTDVVQEGGNDVEDTDDWYAQDINGNVWYCGEVSKNFEFIAGDNPQVSELVDLEGSWKAFRDYAMPGILMQADPQIGDVYRQEMLLTDAEDIAEVLDNAASGMMEGDHCTEEGAIIAAFVDLMCNGDCLITKDFTPLSPGEIEHKYYVPGVGFILETKPDGECVVQEGVI